MRTFFLTSLLAVAAGSLPAQITYVDANALGLDNGSSWANAYTDLATALGNASSGDTLWVAKSIYSGSFVIPAGVRVLGGFLGDIPPPQPAPPTPPEFVGHVSLLQREVTNVTAINAFGTGLPGVTLGEGSEIDGFQIFLGGGGVMGGGGALVNGVSCTIRNCAFQANNNTAGNGAAVLVQNGGNPLIENSAFYLNGDSYSGAAIEVDGAQGTYCNLTIDLNWNSGMRLKRGGTANIYNVIFSNNGVGGVGAGIEQVDLSVDPCVQNCLFFGNNTAHYIRGTTNLTTIAQVNALSFASGNITGDPLYVAANNYRLQQTSAAIDAGGTHAPARNQGLYDQPRILDGNLDGTGIIDIGAAEFGNAEMRIPVDIHRHIHIQVTGTAGLPVFMILNAGFPLAEIPSGFLVPGIGHLFVSPVGMHLFAFSVLPVPAAQAIINYPGRMPRGVLTYWQAVTAGGSGINLSNPGIHVTN